MKTKIFAFTLAEVLITLAVIGIVAAITIPTLVSEQQEKATVTKVKKMYNTLSNAYKMHVATNGKVDLLENSEEGALTAYKIFAPYLNIADDCGTDCTGSFSTVNYRKNGTSSPSYANNTNFYKVILNDGSALAFRGGGFDSPSYTYELEIIYDINGKSGPNRWGHDLFAFDVFDGELYPNGIPGISQGETTQDCLSSDGNGFHCAAWVVYKENLDYLKCPGSLTWSDSKCN